MNELTRHTENTVGWQSTSMSPTDAACQRIWQLKALLQQALPHVEAARNAASGCPERWCEINELRQRVEAALTDSQETPR